MPIDKPLYWPLFGCLNAIIIKSDSLRIVKAMLESSTHMSTVGYIIEDSKVAFLGITRASVAHIRCQGNGVAHCLACFALPMESTSCSWLGTW
ncbi:unnamed protein product [Malus baccata var. baccata]